MADKKNIADENYLDNLLRAITGEAEDGATANTNEDELDFDGAVKADGTEEEFLSDFEKEFFDESENKMLDGMFDEEQKQEEIPDDMLFDLDSDILGEFDDNASASDTSVNSSESKELVDEAVDKGDSSVEEDLQGLYGILGVDNEGGLPENVEEKPKKKGFFGRNKDKKKKEKKSRKKGKNASNSNEAENAEPAQNIDPALEGFDVEALFNNPDTLGESGADSFDMSGDLGLSLEEPMGIDMGMGSDESSGEYDFGLDDSGFGGMNENDMLIRQMDEGGLDEEELLSDNEDSSKKKGKKDKKKKGKKDKKSKKGKKGEEDDEEDGKSSKKSKAKSKAKKPKKEKEPKEKKPRDPDEIISISPVAVILMLSFIIVAVIATKMGGDYYYYQERVNDAVELYCNTDTSDIDKYESRYSEAYTLLSGMEMKSNEHQTFFEMVQTVMFMDRHYEAYKNYMLLEDFDHGLDSLIKAVKMYDKYQNDARDLGCFDDMTVVLSWVNDKLESTYGITESRARELYMITDDQEYAVEVRAIAAEAKDKYDAVKVEEE